MTPRTLAGVLLVLIVVMAGNSHIALATDIYKTNSVELPIPDDSSWANSGITISDTIIPDNAVITGVDLSFTSNHQRSQDIEVSLRYGSTIQHSTYIIWNHEGGTDPNPAKTVNGITLFNGLGVKKDWYLYVKDTSPGATGSITSWSIRVYYTAASGPGSPTYSVTASFLNNLTFRDDENGDGYAEEYEFLSAINIAAPSGIKVYPKIICNTTGQAWRSQIGNYNNDHVVQYWDQGNFLSYITQNTALNFTVELWDDSTFTHTKLASTSISGGPINVGVGYFPSVWVNNWIPNSDSDTDGYYDTYQLELGVQGTAYAGPADVMAKIICINTGQAWWASVPWTITYPGDTRYFDFSEADFAGYVSDNESLDFLIELWDPGKTVKLGSTAYHGDYITGYGSYASSLKVDSASCSVAVNNLAASSSLFDPYTGGFTNFSATIDVTPSATWRLNINGDDVAVGNTVPFSQAWFGKNSLGQILEPGTYAVTLTAADPSGQCTDSKSISVTVDRRAPPHTNSCETITEIPIGSTTNITTGDVAHSQALFSLKGAPLSTGIELFYNSLNPYNGPLGPSWSHTYDISITENADGSILLREGNGGKGRYTKSGSSYISPPGDFSTLVKNADGTYVITYRDGHKYNFRPDGKIASIVDRFNNATTFAYPNGDLDTITDPAQRVTKFIYDTTVTPHRLTSITDPNLKTYDFIYQGTNCSNRLCRVTDPIADPTLNQIRGYWEYQYDTQGFLKSKRDPENNLTQYYYYPDHRFHYTVDPEGVSDPTDHTRSVVYPTASDNLRTTTITEKDGGLWLYTYDAAAGVLTQKTAQNTTTNSITTTYTYTPNGYLRSRTVPKDESVRLTTFYSYDAYGNLLTETDPVDLSIYTNSPIDPETVSDSTLANLTPPIKPAFRYSYDYANYDQIASISNERSTPFATTTYDYSEAGGYKVTTVTDPDSHVTTYRYNPNGTLKDITDGNNKAVSFDYKPNGLLNTFTDLNGVITTFSSYDTNGNALQVKVKDTNNKELTTNFVVDTLNRLTRITKLTAAFPDNITKFAYDLNGNRTSVIDAETHETKYEYRYDGQVKKITDARLKDTILTYGANGCPSCSGVDKLGAITDARQHTTNYYYDQLGRLEHETDPLNKSIRYTYYDSGKVKEKIDSSSVPEKILITYYYDNLGRLTRKQYLDGSEDNYGYDPKGNLQTAYNADITYIFDYYSNGWLKSVKDGAGKTLASYDQYDGIGQRKQVTILPGSSDQRVTTYDYDGANRPWHIYAPAGTFVYDYDYSGRRKSLTYPNQTIADYGYDDLDRLTSLTHSVVGGSAFLVYGYPTHDQVGNRKVRTGTYPATYDYDEIYRLRQAVTANGTENFTYDEVGNRQTGPGFKDIDYAYNDANQVTTGRKLQYTYDDYGNQKTRVVPNAPEKSWTLDWDYENRLKKAEMLKGTERRTVTFKYDSFGRRIEKKLVTVIDGVTKTYIYSYLYDNEDVVQETLTIDGGPPTKTYFTYGPGIDEPLALERGGSFYYYHADGLGSIATITNASKQVVQGYEYESFGLVRPSTNFANSYTFTGREWDRETGLMYFRGRTYDMREGRFLSKDPISFNGGDVNLYGCVLNNPINFKDPTGLLVYADYVRSTGVLTVTDYDTGERASMYAESGGKPWGDPIPVGAYEILDHPNPDFLRLDPIDTTLRNDVDDASGRNHFRLHKPGNTTGCIAAKNEQDWQKVRDLIRRTRTKTVNDNAKPWWKIWGGRENINFFGTMTVR